MLIRNLPEAQTADPNSLIEITSNPDTNPQSEKMRIAKIFEAYDSLTQAEKNAFLDSLNLNSQYALLAAGLSGTGSPEGVVTATVGTVYRDTAATNGAVVWVKATGSGNTGWSVVFGDTGWRALVEWDGSGTYSVGTLSASFAPRSGQPGGLYIRRIGTECFFAMANVQANATLSALTAYELTPVPVPTGFRAGPSPRTVMCTIATNQGITHMIRDLTLGGNIQLVPYASYSLTNVVAHGGRPESARYTTTDQWPTTLPGSAA